MRAPEELAAQLAAHEQRAYGVATGPRLLGVDSALGFSEWLPPAGLSEAEWASRLVQMYGGTATSAADGLVRRVFTWGGASVVRIDYGGYYPPAEWWHFGAVQMGDRGWTRARVIPLAAIPARTPGGAALVLRSLWLGVVGLMRALAPVGGR